tara:strand:+ start:291 stop:500 length:210 start_codon:yes stop_codon:yes gene_type:complete
MTNNTGMTITVRTSENMTVKEVTNPKSRITGIGDAKSTMNPQMVVPADRPKATPVVESVRFIACHGLSP